MAKVSAPAAPAPDPCVIAAGLRAKVKPFLEEGRLHRTVKLIEKADRLCPKSAPETRAALVTTLAELGHYEETRQVAAQIEADSKASGEDKAAATAAKERCDKLDKVFPREGEAKEAMKRLYLEALANDADAPHVAKEKYLAAWEAWRPNGEALLSAGFAAKKLGQKAEAQRLFDRAIVDGEKDQHANVQLDVPNGFGGSISALAWTKDGRRLSVAHGNEISTFDSTWREKSRFRGEWKAVTSMSIADESKGFMLTTIGQAIAPQESSAVAFAYSFDGKKRISVSVEGLVKFEDIDKETKIIVLEGFMKGTTALAYSPNGKVLATGGHGRGAQIWNASNGKLVRELPGKTTAIAYSPDGQFLALGYSDTVQLWDTTANEVVADLQTKSDVITALAYSPDGQTLAVGVDHLGVLHKVRLWSPVTRKLTRTLEEHTSYHNSTKYSPNGETIASGFFEGTVRVWNVAAGQYGHTFYGHSEGIQALAYSPDGKTIASGSSDKTVRLWDVERGRMLDKFEGHTGTVAAVAYSPDGKTLMSYGTYPDYAIYLWDSKTGKLAHKLEGHQSLLWATSYSPDGKLLASASGDQTVGIWNVADGKLVHLLKGHRDVVTSVAYSPDGRTLASGSTDGIGRLWDVATGKPLHTFNASAFEHGPGNWFATIWSLAYVEDQRKLAVRLAGRTLDSATGNVTAIWDLPNGSIEQLIEGPANAVFWGGHSKRDKTVILDDRDFNSIHLQRLGDDSQRIELRGIANQDAAYARVPSGHIDFYGADSCSARQYPICRIGNKVFPFEVCEERFYAPGLLANVHRGDTRYLEPENAPVLMNCVGPSR
ncbi:MAG TPA: WD40 repeat domain-containing protein [Polyangium sp.]|nr:WD40 repeat domain-containing protein [Polyangium sp.]